MRRRRSPVGWLLCPEYKRFFPANTSCCLRAQIRSGRRHPQFFKTSPQGGIIIRTRAYKPEMGCNDKKLLSSRAWWGYRKERCAAEGAITVKVWGGVRIARTSALKGGRVFWRGKRRRRFKHESWEYLKEHFSEVDDDILQEHAGLTDPETPRIVYFNVKSMLLIYIYVVYTEVYTFYNVTILSYLILQLSVAGMIYFCRPKP